jgi:transposase
VSKPLVSDELWAVVEPLLPPEPPKPKGGRPRMSDRAALSGILFVLKSGIGWELFPQELGCGSGMTCWRRLRNWHQARVWERPPDPAAALAGCRQGGLVARRWIRHVWRPKGG